MAVEGEVVRCPHCQGSEVVKYGTTSNGKARYRCQQEATWGRTFIWTYAYPGCVPEVKQPMVEMTLKGSGIRDIARVLQVGPTPVIEELKKSGRPFAGEQRRGRGMLSGRHDGGNPPS
jgi:transposase-like protein